MNEVEERVLCGAIHNVLDRLIAAEQVVMLLAKFDPKGKIIFPFEQLQELARRYVVTNMQTTVGVRKMAREKWKMLVDRTGR
jgi:hypothetical protein